MKKKTVKQIIETTALQQSVLPQLTRNLFGGGGGAISKTKNNEGLHLK